MSLNHGKEGASFEQAKAEWHITDIVGYSNKCFFLQSNRSLDV